MLYEAAHPNHQEIVRTYSNLETLCFPASADSIPTSLGQEDHVSMGSISGRKVNQVLDNLEYILAIELMSACQAIEFRRPLKSSATTGLPVPTIALTSSRCRPTRSRLGRSPRWTNE